MTKFLKRAKDLSNSITPAISTPYYSLPGLITRQYSYQLSVHLLSLMVLYSAINTWISESQQTVFAIATSPDFSFAHLLQACLWTWIHGFLCNVSNQVMSQDEDIINHPWRPLPAGRISQLQAFQLRWLMVALCILWSAVNGRELIPITLSLVFITFLYDELGLSSHPFGKNVCSACAYATFELGVSKIMGILTSLFYCSYGCLTDMFPSCRKFPIPRSHLRDSNYSERDGYFDDNTGAGLPRCRRWSGI